MRWSLTSLAAIAWLAGCVTATTENYEALLKTWVGRSEGDLVQAWGPPSSTFQSASAKYFTYTKSRTCISGKDSSTCACNTTFELSSDHIKSWRWDGNGCIALPPDIESLPFSTGRSEATPTGRSAP